MTDISATDPTARRMLRHILATLAYRAAKTVRGTPEAFATYRVTPASPSAQIILAHMGDLMDGALRRVKGDPAWTNATPLPWDQEIARFFSALGALDAHLASGATIHVDPGVLFQGVIADALTHTGQLAMLRRLSGHKMKGESYARADIQAGRVGIEQTPADPQYEFD